MSPQLTALIIGIAIGGISSLIGAGTSYGLYLRRDDGQTTGPLGIVLVITATLVMVGIIAILVALYVGQLMQVILTGLGIFIGLALSFVLLLFVWQRMTN